MKFSPVLVIFTVLVARSTAYGAETGCTNLISSSITRFFASLEKTTLPPIDGGAIGSLKDIKIKGLNNVKISELITNEEGTCNIRQITLVVKDLEINAQYKANQLTIPNLVSNLTGTGEVSILATSLVVKANVNVNLVNCFEIIDVQNLLPIVTSGKITLSSNPEKEGEVNENAIKWVATDLVELLRLKQPQVLSFVRLFMTQALNCKC